MSSSATFRRQLLAELKRTPWWVVSIVIHTALLQAFFQIPLRVGEGRRVPVGNFETETPLPFEPEEFEKAEPVALEEIDIPVLEAELDDTDVESMGDPIPWFPGNRAIGAGGGAAAIGGPSSLTCIGIGGGAGGAFGGRGGYRAAGGRNLLVVERADGPQAAPVWNGMPVTQGMLVTEAGVSFPLKHTKVRAEVSLFLASVDLTQRYENPFAKKVEATYVFPLPRTAAVSGFEMTVGDRVIRGVVRERGEARRIYEEAKSRGLTVSLLTQERPNVFTQHLANLEAGRPVDVKIRYFHRLRAVEDGYEFVFPMVVAPRYTPGRPGGPSRVSPPLLPGRFRPGHDVSLSLSIDAGIPIERIDCPTHDVVVERPSPSRADVRLREKTVIPNRDFVLRFGVLGEGPRLGLLTHRGKTGGYFALVAAPKADLDPAEVSPREMVFVLDCSGSMSGDPIAKSKAVVRRFLEGMSPRDTFRVLRFSNRSSGLSDASLAVTPENVRRALAYVDALEGGGGTEMKVGIRAALDPPIEPGRIRMVCFLTDGLIGNETDVLATVRKRLGDARIFAFGVGSSTNRHLLAKLAEEGRGAAQFVLPATSADDAAEEFFRRLDAPYLTDLEVDFGGIPVSDVLPNRIPDVFRGRPLTVVGRYRGGGDTVLTVRGRMGGRPFVREIPVTFPEWEGRHAVLAKVWARARIERLMDAMVGRVTKEGMDEILRVALEHGLVSTFTAFVAVDESRSAGPGGCRRVAVPVYLPQGISYRGVFGDRGDYFALHPLGLRFAAEQRGLRVTAVEEGSPASVAGLRVGDLLTEVNGARVGTGLDAEDAAGGGEDEVRLRLRRGGTGIEARFYRTR